MTWHVECRYFYKWRKSTVLWWLISSLSRSTLDFAHVVRLFWLQWIRFCKETQLFPHLLTSRGFKSGATSEQCTVYLQSTLSDKIRYAKEAVRHQQQGFQNSLLDRLLTLAKRKKVLPKQKVQNDKIISGCVYIHWNNTFTPGTLNIYVKCFLPSDVGRLRVFLMID